MPVAIGLGKSLGGEPPQDWLEHVDPRSHESAVGQPEFGLTGKPVRHLEKDQRTDEKKGEGLRIKLFDLLLIHLCA